MKIVFPALPYQPVLDPMWETEFKEAKRRGYAVALYDSESQKLHGAKDEPGKWLYRGWMLSPAEYGELAERLDLLVSLNMYLSSHLTSKWYPVVAEETMRSEMKAVPLSLDFTQGQKYFVKGAFKSFGNESYVTSEEDLKHLYRTHSLLLGDFLFVRDFVELVPNSERRYFVTNIVNSVDCHGEPLPPEIARLLHSLAPRKFYSIDVALTPTLHGNRPIIVEIGDGQVSDIKEWGTYAFYNLVIQHLNQAPY